MLSFRVVWALRAIRTACQIHKKQPPLSVKTEEREREKKKRKKNESFFSPFPFFFSVYIAVT